HALVVISHFTGHLATGFGAAIKNMGMGCASRRGKLIQHSTAKPSIRVEKCTGCRECQAWCPQDAIFFAENTAAIDEAKCIGCAECLAVCRYDAVGYNWSETYENLQKKVAEHARGVRACHPEKAVYFNFLLRITKDCDCMSRFERIAPDLGILMSSDPVAVDAAALDLVEDHLGGPLSRHAYEIPYRTQLEHGAAIGLGEPTYQLEEV
ncbi:MAG: DUF362 domain-containing protein, partial [Acidobacteria bacterium]|nr:DUF362 domain-containing protein [Acidobacteriota bacterium]